MKFSVKSIYPISTFFSATNCRASWESVAVEVESLFMGDGSRDHRQIRKVNYDFRYLSIGVLHVKPQLDKRSGKYRRKNTVPI
ncbi:hypothetical protein I8751_00015 [Nostocaceae cyanobacterium CENA357]|uniref:Uncharacterized protein n=1 Tax=Atlanticothrix silvestris CENA357 TaxID=1725252 RepID=A0A8J7H5H6_9CYAN|nr:hypothetical protein [Atlanticothrix silvestris]MBH8550801.1 hypothetical protein [Atlanticothrix silvestris CENA357]